MTLQLVSTNYDVGPPGEQHHAAMAAGARCDICPLRNLGRGPVPATIPADVDVLVVAEAPGQTEIQQGAPLLGASGKEVRRALTDAGADMARIGYTNACMCAPLVDMKKYLQQCKKRGETSPIDACRPRLQREMARARFILLMGGASLTAAGVKGSVMSIRGTPITAEGIPALATPHAAFVMRDDGARYRPVFRADIAKAVRISRTGSTWRDPWYFVPKTAAEVANFLAVDRPRVAVDVETDGIDPWTCGMRRVGIGTDREVMIYSPLSVKGHALLSDDERVAQTRVIADYFRRAPRLDVHNGIAFDSVVLHRHGMPLPDANTFDQIVGHQVGLTSELPHKLDFLGSMYTDAPFWKNTFKHSTVKDDGVLDKYLSYDIAVTHVSAGYVEQNLIASSQVHVYTLDAELFRIGRSMAALGIYIDPVKRFEFAQEYQEKSDRLRAEFVEMAGRDINPASYPQIRKLLYEDLGLPILEEHITDSDEPSTDENTLLDLLGMGVDKRAENVIHSLIGYREAEKLLGTNTGHVESGILVGGPPVHLDGRLRTSWRPGKVTGRWGSSDPVNLTNIPKKLRAMYQPAPGNTFVGADMSAVELRLIALLANDAPLIEAFKAFDEKRGPDVHTFNACNVFGCKPEEVTDVPRRFIKCVAAGTRIAVPGRGYVRVEELTGPTPVVTEKGLRGATELHDVGTTACVRVVTSKGVSIVVAKRHRLMLATGKWRWAENLKVGDELKVVLPEHIWPAERTTVKVNPWVTRTGGRSAAPFPQDLSGLPDVVIDERMAYLFGTMLGDGGICPTGSYVTGLLVDGVLAEATRCAKELGLPTYYQRVYRSKDKGDFGRLNIHSANWRRFLVRLGMHDGKKVLRVPDVIFRSPRPIVVAFLAGLFDTDGTVGDLTLCSKCAEFISDVAMLVGMLGLQGGMHESWNKTYGRMYYLLRFRRASTLRFVAMGGMRAPGKLKRQKAKMARWGSRARVEDPLVASAKVVSVERAGRQRVYDLTVPTTHSYVANGLVNHNSFVYALSYDAQPPKIFQTLSLLRDDNLNPMFPSITLQEIERFYKMWWLLHPAIPVWKKKLIYMWRAQRYLESHFHKRKRYFIGGESATEFSNFPIQSAAADMQNDAILAIVRAYPFDFARHRGLVLNVHDQLVVECGIEEVEGVKAIVRSVMEKRIGEMRFPAEPRAGGDWKVVS